MQNMGLTLIIKQKFEDLLLAACYNHLLLLAVAVYVKVEDAQCG